MLDQRIDVPRSATLQELGEPARLATRGRRVDLRGRGGRRSVRVARSGGRGGRARARRGPGAAARPAAAALHVRTAQRRPVASLAPKRVSVAVVMAAGLGTRLRPLTERWPKPILPVDGRPVIVTLLHELAAGGFDSFVVVVGHLAEQVEELLAPLPYAIRIGRRSRRRSALPTRCAGRRRSRRSSSPPPTRSTARGDPGRFWRRFEESGAAGAISMRRQPGRPVGDAHPRRGRARRPGRRSLRRVGLHRCAAHGRRPRDRRADRRRPPRAAVRAGRMPSSRRSTRVSVSRRSKSGRRGT